MLANNSADNIDAKSSDSGKAGDADTAVATPEKVNPDTPTTATATATAAAPAVAGAAPAAAGDQPKRSIGVKEVIPFAWKLLGDACDGMTMTLYKAVEREEVEAHLERSTRDGHYENLRIVEADEKVVQPKVKNPLHYINTPKAPPPPKKPAKPVKVKVIAPKVVMVKRKKTKAKAPEKTTKKAAAKKKTKKTAVTKKVKKKVVAAKKKVAKKAATKKAVKKKAPAKKKAVVKKKAPAKKKAVAKKPASTKKKASVKKKAPAKKKKK